MRDAASSLRRDLVLSILAAASVGIGMYELARTRPDRAFTFLDAVDLAIVGVFVADFAWQARRSGDAWRYARRHWWEWPSLVPVTGGMVEGLDGVALVRGVRLWRLVRFARLFRIVSATPRFRRSWRYARRVGRRAHVGAVTFVAIVLVGVTTPALFAAEVGENDQVDTVGDAAWWSLRVFLGGGFEPVTLAGRVLSVAVRVLGMATLGVFVAGLTSAIVREAPDEDED